MLSGLLAVTAAGASNVWPFFALAFVQGVGSAIGAPAGRSLTPSLVPEEILVSALAQRSIAFQGSAVVGPAIGGILFAIQPELVYVVAIVLSLAALGCVLAMRSGRLPVVGRRRRVSDEVLAGVRLIRRTNVLLGRDLARPLRGAPRRRGRAAAGLREGHPGGRADGPRLPARGAGGRLARLRGS